MRGNKPTRTSTENNPTIINPDTSISAMKENVQVSFRQGVAELFITKAGFGS